MKAIVKYIQVDGSYDAHSLGDACVALIAGGGYKIHFAIELPDGSMRTITIRDDENGTVAYGDFEGLPDFLDYSKEVAGK